MADLSTHYKEITPEQTVQNVTDFFNNHNLKIKITDVNESEAKTWFCRVDLYQGPIRLCGANGKGVSKEYALASGHAELYERFCNGMNLIANPYWNFALIEYNMKKYGYHYCENEKLMSYNEAKSESHRLKNTLHYLTNDIDILEKAYLDYITDGQYIGVPMYNIENIDDKIYIDPRVLLRITRSVGMSAGNTLEEALNQGMSEIVEVQAQDKLFRDWANKQFYALDLEQITNPTLQKIINAIKKLGYKLYLIDLSYNYNLPVMMSIIIDPTTHFLNYNIGAFPVFEIAAERVLTELYQGITSYRTDIWNNRVRTPFKTMSVQDIYSFNGNSLNGDVFPYQFFDNLQIKNTYNSEIYINSGHSNHDIYEYFINLAKKQNYKFYYRDNSKSSNIKAVHIICEGEKVYNGEELDICWYSKMNLQHNILTLERLRKLMRSIYDNTVNYGEFIDLLTKNDYSTPLFNSALLWENLVIGLATFNSIMALNDLLYQQYLYMNSNYQHTILEDSMKKYLTIKIYCLTNAYTSEELLKLFNNILEFNITKEDIDNGLNAVYLLKHAYIEPMYKFLHGEDLKSILAIFK